MPARGYEFYQRVDMSFSSEGTRVPKFHLLGRIGPKKVLQTRSEPANRLRSSEWQKNEVGIFVTSGWAPAHAQGGFQSAFHLH